MRLKYGDVFVWGDCVGKILNPAVNQQCYTIKWFHNPSNRHYYQPTALEKYCEVLPKDVAENLVALYTKENK
jgi:hypothetical protein